MAGIPDTEPSAVNFAPHSHREQERYELHSRHLMK
jgi:hypothetical protein